MSIASELRQLIRSGVHRIGQIEILSDVCEYAYVLCHQDDVELATQPAFGGLDVYEDPNQAREISTYAEDGTYRFTKGQCNLKRGWVMVLTDEENLRRALDLFYPAAAALFLAQKSGTLQIQHLRDKLNRQTGMYRFARTISTDGAQQLVRKVCGPENQCAKRILWQINEQTPLDDSPASRFNGFPDDLDPAEAIPLMCREACNHFVAECRQLAKAEHAAKEQSASNE